MRRESGVQEMASALNSNVDQMKGKRERQIYISSVPGEGKQVQVLEGAGCLLPGDGL